MSVVLRQRGVVNSFPRKTEFMYHVYNCLAKARLSFSAFKLQDHEIPVVFVAKGRAAGMAKFRKNALGITYNLEFNVDAINKDWDEMVSNTIPHEIAHIVDHAIHGKFNGHNRIWQRICMILGGDATRTHDIPVEKARKTRKVLYKATCGSEIWLTMRMHNQLQRGSILTVRKTGGKITAQHCTGRMQAV